MVVAKMVKAVGRAAKVVVSAAPLEEVLVMIPLRS
jgi:hypothetical protein